MTQVGIGWRQPHYEALLRQRPRLGFIEVHSENFFADGGAALAVLERGRAHYAVSLHGVGLALGSVAGLDPWHLERLARLVRRIDPVRVSDHAAFARAPLQPGQPPVHGADLLPIAFTEASLGILLRNVAQVQDRLRRPIAVENLAAYLRWADDRVAEAQFFDELAQRSGCTLLLDLNNLVVNALNRGDDPVAAACRFVDAITPQHVVQVHLAGFSDRDALAIDDHGSRVREPVWQVFGHAVRRLGPRPTLIEWDTDVPALDVLLAEARRAHEVMAAAWPQCMSMRATPATTPAAPSARASAPVQASAPAQADAELHTREAQRQQQLLRTLWRRELDDALAPWLYETGARAARGLAAYRGNAAAIAERALAAAYPTVRQLVSADSFALLARSVWQRQPPQCGDLAQYGAGLADAIAADAQLASEPYLADIARLDWAVHTIEHAADATTPVPGLQRLADEDPAKLRLVLRPGLQVLRSCHPIVLLWQAHWACDGDGVATGAAGSDGLHDDAVDERFAAARAALTRGDAETALVSRTGWRATVQRLDASDTRFFVALLSGEPLARALDAAGDGFSFERWLQRALTQQWLRGVEATAGHD